MKKARSKRRIKKSMKLLQAWSDSLPPEAVGVINMLADMNSILAKECASRV